MEYDFQEIPKSRIATFDVYEVGARKHHVSALLEFDVTETREKLKELKRSGTKVSFTSWILKVIGTTLDKHPEVAASIFSKRKLIVFKDINISIVVEKEINGQKVPIPMVIEKVNEKNLTQITNEIEKSKDREINEEDVILNKKSTFGERIYYRLPGFLRRLVWRYILSHPVFAYKKMGNVVVTSLGMIGRINGWFIHRSVHPISFGIGSVLPKPWVVDKEIRIRDILNMTVLIDHDVVDGAPMVRFLNDFTKSVESGEDI